MVSALARVEVPAALWRKHRLGELSAADTALLVEAFEWDWFDAGALIAVGLTDAIVASAARLVGRYPLRAYDAVQLATALAAREADPGLTGFACFDQALATAARSERFALVAS